MTYTYTYADLDGCGLTIEPCAEREATACLISARGACVPAADLPKIVRELYRAAGQQPPILLPRYQPNATMTRHGKVRPMVTPTGDDMAPAEARDLAAWYATAADLAEETDAQRVGQLADVIDAATNGAWTPEAIARAVLAAGYTRSES
ncbi:hypothetical protein ACGF0J_21750 [Nonomuraea sp. NPDC047897]|uniref:hypothetical protein n=1 Tax=Nonomuraea sp. NPDC047897 TaxID=3364346 RepID=UPI00371903DC